MKKLKLLLLAALAFANAHGQKLPDVQQTSLRPPADIKIDGKPTEWNNKFEAYNHATDLYYTMCNDDKNLYLAIQVNNPTVLSKITNRGIILTLNSTGKKTDQGAVSIHYPVFEPQYNNKPFIRFSNASGLTADQRMAIASNPDSVLNVMNKKLRANDKFIRTSGIPNVDTLISIYNDKDIVAHEAFEKGVIYTYEMAIPLKYLKVSNSTSSKLSYHIVLKGISVDEDIRVATAPDGHMIISLVPGAVTIKNEYMPAAISTTDFWGEYTLAK